MTWLRSQFRTFEAAFRWWRTNLTWGGKALSLATLLCVPGLTTLESTLFLLFSAQLSLLFVAGLVNYLNRPQLEIRPDFPDLVGRDQPFDICFVLWNRGAHPIGDLSLDLREDPEIWSLSSRQLTSAVLEQGRSIEFKTTLRAKNRGVHSLPELRAISTFPFNLFRMGRIHSIPGQVFAVPSYRPLTSLELVQQSAAATIEHAHHRVTGGHGEEYIGSREYVPGIFVRRWDYGSWARLNQPIAREFAELPDAATGIVVDNVIATTQEQADLVLEGILSLAAGLSDILASKNHQILFGASGDSNADLESTSGTEQHRSLLRYLATVQGCRHFDANPTCDLVARSQPIGSTLYFLLRDWDASREAIYHEAVSRGWEVIRIFVNARITEDLPLSQHDYQISVEEINNGEVSIG